MILKSLLISFNIRNDCDQLYLLDAVVHLLDAFLGLIVNLREVWLNRLDFLHDGLFLISFVLDELV